MDSTSKTSSLTMRVRHALKSRLEKLSRATGRSRSYLAAEAISAYLDTNEWQVAGIKAALASLDRGEGLSHAGVTEWIASWQTRAERPAPGGL
jgi:RHH-type transcriptional regulator, rel operon repressor / antitoxin RelB